MALSYNASYFYDGGNTRKNTSVIITAKNVGFTVETVENDCLNAVKALNNISPTQYEKQSLVCEPATEDTGKAYDGTAVVDVVVRTVASGMKRIMLQDLPIVVDDANDFEMILAAAIENVYKAISASFLSIEQITFKF